MSRAKETKQEKFLRLAHRRLYRALEEIRLISQLASANYENTPEQAQEVIRHLDKAVRQTAKVFDVPYRTMIGLDDGSRRFGKQIGRINEIDVAKAIDAIQAQNYELAIKQLRDALNQEAR